MKILWVKPGKLLPLDTGGKLRTYNILRYLTRQNKVTYLSYYHGRRDWNYERDIAVHIPDAIPLYTGCPELSGLYRVADYLRNLPSPIPYAVSKFSARPVRQVLKEWLQPGRFDVVVCDFLASTPNFPSDIPIPAVLFQHNVETVLWKRRAQFAERSMDRLVASIESKKMVSYEATQLQRFHHVIAVSEQDRQSMGEMLDISRISVVPTGVDTFKYRYDARLRPAHPLVVFTGSMDWEPNIDGVEYFCREIWPRVLQQVPMARFRIVGRSPDARVKRLSSASIDVTGTVNSIEEHLREAMVIVAPLRMGGGTRIKIYEGMAMGKATVSTTVGAEGLDVSHQEDILLADEPIDFARYIVNLLSDENARRRLERKAATTAQKYDWAGVTKHFEHILQNVVQSVSKGSSDSQRIFGNTANVA